MLTSLDDKIEKAVKRQLDLAATPNSNAELDVPLEGNNDTLELDLNISPAILPTIVSCRDRPSAKYAGISLEH